MFKFCASRDLHGEEYSLSLPGKLAIQIPLVILGSSGGGGGEKKRKEIIIL